MAHKISEKARTADIELSCGKIVTFSSLLLSPAVLSGLEKAGFVRPSPVQLEAIPIGRCGFDVIVQAKSGTGKTCVFVVIALETVNVNSKNTQALVLAPTREIGVQIAEVFRLIGSCTPKLKCCAFIGGLPLKDDMQKLKGCHIAVGTPGRIKQLIQGGSLRTDAIRLFVLDEADKLLEESFQKDINWIYHKLPTTKQMLALSATYPEALAELLKKYMQSPKLSRINSNDVALLGIRQFYMITEFHPLQTKAYENKIPKIFTILKTVQFSQCLIFSNYQIRAQGLRDRLNSCGWPTEFISGKQVQKDRLQVMNQLKKFKCRILVTTDLTARGIDVDNVNLIINLDVPQDLETYLHRIGRAGRFGSLGLAISLAASGTELETLKHMQSKGNLKLIKISDDLIENLWEMDEQVCELMADPRLDNGPLTPDKEILIRDGSVEKNRNGNESNELNQPRHNFSGSELTLENAEMTQESDKTAAGEENLENVIQNWHSGLKSTANSTKTKKKKVNRKYEIKLEAYDDYEGMRIGAVMLEKLQLEHEKELINKGKELRLAIPEYSSRTMEVVNCDGSKECLKFDFNIESEEDSLLRFNENVTQNGGNCPVCCDQTSVIDRPIFELIEDLSESDLQFLGEKHREFLSLIPDNVLMKGLFDKICSLKVSLFKTDVQLQPDAFDNITNSIESCDLESDDIEENDNENVEFSYHNDESYNSESFNNPRENGNVDFSYQNDESYSSESSDSEFDSDDEEEDEVIENRHVVSDESLSPTDKSLRNDHDWLQFTKDIMLSKYSVFQSEYIRLMLQTRKKRSN